MGKVVFEDPIHHISGRISKKYRTVYNYSRLGERKFTSVHGDRTTPVTSDELKRRNKFRIVRLAAKERSMDLSNLTQDQMLFIAERKAGINTKYLTYRGWLFGKAWKYFDEGTNQVIWPASLA